MTSLVRLCLEPEFTGGHVACVTRCPPGGSMTRCCSPCWRRSRQRTLRATVDWSYSLLSGAEQVLLGRLPVFAESFDVDAEAVCGFGGIEALDVTDLFGSLVDKNLVLAEPVGGALRYRMLGTIRQFAAERLAEAGEGEAAAVAAAHCEHFLSVAEAAAPHLTGPDQGGWLARLDADQANLRRAAEYAARRPDRTAQVLRFGGALRRYWEARPGTGKPSACWYGTYAKGTTLGLEEAHEPALGRAASA